MVATLHLYLWIRNKTHVSIQALLDSKSGQSVLDSINQSLIALHVRREWSVAPITIFDGM